MKEARLILGDDSLSRSNSGHIHGLLCIQVEELRFPSADWNDFVVVVLGWWCRACHELIGNGNGSPEVPFMDGPYRVQMQRHEKQSIELKLIENRSSGSAVQHQAHVSEDVLLESVVAAAEKTVSECGKRQWWSRDVDELADAVKSLKQARLRSLLGAVP
jgi:hypothetical protein